MMNATKDVKHQTPGNESMNIFANQDVTIADDIEKMQDAVLNTTELDGSVVKPMNDKYE